MISSLLGEAMGLARKANGYSFVSLPSASPGTGSACLDCKAPWFQIKEDRQAAATSVLRHAQRARIVDNLKTILAPILPHTAQRLHEYLGYDGQLFGKQQVVEYQEETRSRLALTYDHSGAIGTWRKSKLPAEQALREPVPLFKKLDKSAVEEETARLAG